MIKVNLLPQRKVKRAAEPGQGQVAAGIGVLAAAAAAVFFLVHKPMRDARKDYEAKADELRSGNDAAQAKLADYETLKKVVAEQEIRRQSIIQLAGDPDDPTKLGVRAVPANLMHELGRIMTLQGKPNMTREMTEKVGTGPGSDPNKAYAADWDPKHVWITSFVEKKGDFVLEGGAQADSDVTELAKRMQASVHFLAVTPQGLDKVEDATSKTSFYKFTITGKVVY